MLQQLLATNMTQSRWSETETGGESHCQASGAAARGPMSIYDDYFR